MTADPFSPPPNFAKTADAFRPRAESARPRGPTPRARRWCRAQALASVALSPGYHRIFLSCAARAEDQWIAQAWVQPPSTQIPVPVTLFSALVTAPTAAEAPATDAGKTP